MLLRALQLQDKEMIIWDATTDLSDDLADESLEERGILEGVLGKEQEVGEVEGIGIQ